MGYDMYIVDGGGNEIDESGDSFYLHRNIWGGQRLADALVDAGIGYWPTGPQREYPREPDDAEWGDYNYSHELPPANPAATQYQATMFRHLQDTRDERPGISVYKLCGSNDGWWVTKVECESALKMWEQAGNPEVDQYGDVIPFLRAASKHDGFRVW
jgi:hypothetical protein